ncbi:MarP family serine protease [Aeromicrobium sp. 636]|uniref:MarP family serine protease n=1 Tax=Aeromicrobium senzhongii TaxID=2663859 RepID=A0A8I0EXQ2_9ACTN|nr:MULTISPECIES: MarP family serine protease [Aeromicrobium]MBC9227045.1 MarP family serine protease [Aeromicrobium senzhongii]MCQ3999145.1 MarP family serine protease [Aeromicrobium sp. 636]
MNWLDLVLITTFVVYAYAGWVHGFVSNVFSGGGLLLGFLLGIALAPRFFTQGSGDALSAVMSIVFVFVVAAVGNFTGSMIGRSLRIRRGPGRAIDAVLGAAFGTSVVMAASWALGYAVSASTLPYVSAAVRDSTVLQRVDQLMPQRAGEALQAFTDTLTGDVFPRYLDPFETEIIPATEPPDDKTLALKSVRAARASVVRVLGEAECNRTIEGSGFVIARDRIMTNAHVLAGVDEPTVTVGNRRYDARPVWFDPDLDLAVVDVPGLDAKPLRFETGAQQGDPAAVLGFPENGPFDARSARIRGRLDLKGPDIYGNGRVSRDVFSIRSLVRSGNSGGPLISTKGEVIGVIFAASISDPETGYAVTAAETIPIARAAARAEATVSTGQCA